MQNEIIKIKSEAARFGLVIDDEIAEMVYQNCPCIAGSSGGKDSDVLVILLDKFFNAIGYTGERVVIHADLGLIEHVESLPQVERLAAHVGWKLEVVRREKGGLLERYEQRWADNCKRYVELECVTLITPFPHTNMPFCRSETKVAPILKRAVVMFPGQGIINAVGIRREESASRAKKPISKFNEGLLRADGTWGRDYFPILDVLVERVWLVHRQEKFLRHIQYDRGNERISCAFCFLASQNDWQAGLKVETNHPAYRRLCSLELESTYSYQQENWLIDARPDLLTSEMRDSIEETKRRAEKRRLIEKRIPKELLFENHGGRRGWPKFQPDMKQCELLANVRQEIAELMNLPVKHKTADAVYARYTELLIEKEARLAKASKRKPRKQNRVQGAIIVNSNQQYSQQQLFP